MATRTVVGTLVLTNDDMWHNISYSSFPRIAHDGLPSVEGHYLRRMAPLAARTVQTFRPL